MCHWGKRMYVGTVSGFDVWKVSLLSEEGVKTEISAYSESTRLCLGCFNPCVRHLEKSLP